MVDAASSPISVHGSVQLNVARRIDSETSDQENEKRLMKVRGFDNAVRRFKSAMAGTSGALRSSSPSTCRPKRNVCGLI